MQDLGKKLKGIFLTNIIPMNIFPNGLVVFVKVPKYHFRIWVHFIIAAIGLCVFVGVLLFV